MSDLDAEKRLSRLLGAGYLPRELPPPFVSAKFGSFSKAVAHNWRKDYFQTPKTTPDIFSSPRHGRTSRRKLAIVNPISHFYLSQEISNEWDAIKQALSKSKISKFQPTFSTKESVTFAPFDFDEIEEHQNLILSRFNKAVISDISRFYPTLYTHVIAWAIHGKDWCKKNQHEKVFRDSLDNKLDVLVRRGQDNQSVGIPICPETSRIIAEIVGVGIDSLVEVSCGLDADRAYRYVDDLCIGVGDNDTPDKVVSRLAHALSAFELEINVEKTREVDVRGAIEPDWAVEIRNFDLPSAEKGQRKALDFYFKKAFHIDSKYPSQNVLKYAVKRSASFDVSKDNWQMYEAYVLRCMRSNSTTMEAGCQILVDAHRRKRELSQKWIAKFIEDTIIERAPLGHHGEVGWALFLARELGVVLPDSIARLLAELESGICSLLALDLRQKKLLSEKLDVSNWKTFLNRDGLRSHMWMLAYEAASKGWLDGGTKFIEEEEHFKVLLDLEISFYDALKTLPPVIKRKRKAGEISWPPSEFFDYP